ncbi:MAG: stage II sporulation protein D [Clostridia bacterium]
MRVRWGRVLLLAVLTSVLVLLIRGCVIVRCGGEKQTEADGEIAIRVFDHREDIEKRIPLEIYLTGVVAAEMPVAFPEEALKAQAVAARTYTMYHMLHGGCQKHGTDVCTDSGCCQAYCSDERMREKWNGTYKENRRKVLAAVLGTAGEVLLYDGVPIDALYHSASGGQTENVEDVYAAALPYLRSVMSTAEAGSPRIAGEKSLSRRAFCRAANGKWPGANLKEATLEKNVIITKTTPTGRVQHIRLGGYTATGREVRALFALDSTIFTLSFTQDTAMFSTKGYGHGVGMSQTGANAMALGGRIYQEILFYYYTGTDLAKISVK